jgi:hypothetical protein
MELCGYWNKTNPPVHELVAAYLGFGEQEAPEPSQFEASYLARTPAKQFDTLPKFIQDAMAKGKA